MGTTYMVKIHGAEDVDDDIRIDIDAELRRVNDQMSTYLKSSEISRFNASDSTRWFDVSRQTADVVDFAQQVARKTDGAFDVTIGPVVNAWGFGPDQRTGETPDREKLAQLKALTGFEKLSVRLDPPALRKQIPQLQVDLSAIAKGHGVDRVVTLLAEAGATDVFVEIGGEVRTSGDKAGQPWRVGIQLPDTAATVSMIAHETGRGTGQDESMATSGDYRNFFQDDGKRYSHTIDPRTAAPIVHHLASVSVVSQSCMAADAWATAINVLGPEKGLELAERESLDAFLITRTDNGYHMMGTGLLAQYAAIAPPAAAVAADTTVRETASTGLLPTMLMSAVAMGVILLAMAIGVIFGRKAISGSCGGLANETDADGNVSCSLCSNPADACKELRERMQQSESPT
ncbi:MAG: (Na+)-NQR maturation NqrM [Pirellulaceae bacterium]|nr:(Na+)-NQR maturation NqrM [Pirellulaceae bacterium]